MPLLTPVVFIYNIIAVKNLELVLLLQSRICKVDLRLTFINDLGRTY